MKKTNGSAESPAPEVRLSKALSQMDELFGNLLVISDVQRVVLAVWAVHTYVIEAFDRTPYLHIFSPEKRSGKTLTLDLLMLLVNRPWLTSNATCAAIARKISQVKPTALIDEADTFINSDSERAEMIRGILNAGYARGGVFSRCVGRRVEDIDVFCPKAIAGLKELPDTVADRSIRIQMKRAMPEEAPSRFDRREVEPVGAELRDQLKACAKVLIPTIKDRARPRRIEQLNDRQNDIVEPLLVVADLAGGVWPEKLRRALIELCTAPEGEDQSQTTRLLADIKDIFDETGSDRISTTKLVQELSNIEDAPWGSYSRGRALNGHLLGRMLARHQIRPVRIREDGRQKRGYTRDQFEDAWMRYLRPSSQVSEAATSPEGGVVQPEQDAADGGADLAAADGGGAEPEGAGHPSDCFCPECRGDVEHSSGKTSASSAK